MGAHFCVSVSYTHLDVYKRQDINKAACDEGMHTLRQSAEKLVLEGVTSFQAMCIRDSFETSF